MCLRGNPSPRDGNHVPASVERVSRRSKTSLGGAWMVEAAKIQNYPARDRGVV